MPQFIKSLGMVPVSVPSLFFFPHSHAMHWFLERFMILSLLTILPLFLASLILQKNPIIKDENEYSP